MAQFRLGPGSPRRNTAIRSVSATALLGLLDRALLLDRSANRVWVPRTPTRPPTSAIAVSRRTSRSPWAARAASSRAVALRLAYL